MVTIRNKDQYRNLRSVKLLFRTLTYGACCLIVFLVTAIAAIPAAAADPRQEVLPNEGPLGTIVYVRIWDYTPNKQVMVMMGSSTTVTPGTAIVAKETTDSTGYAVASFEVDTFAGGRYTLIIDDGTNKGIAYFRVLPKITLGETTGFVGDAIVIAGNGFAATKPISVFLDDTKVTTGDSDDKGRFYDVKFVLPATAKGDHKIKVVDSEANTTTATYSVKQKMTVSPTSTTVGAELTITGTGFQAKDITIYFDDKDITAVRADVNGGLTAKIKVPACSDGVHKIKADDGLNRSYAEITITSAITINPNSGNIGIPVAIQGSGFRPGFPLTVNYDNTKMDAALVSDQGTFTFNFKVPKSRSGAHSITVTDGVNTQKATFTIEATAPLAPTLNLPADLSRVKEEVHFEWSAVSDPSGVSYVLEIAEDAKFSKIIASTANLLQCSFDLPDDDKLIPTQKTPYYWRVKAIDGASNEGPWSSVGSFYKGYTLETVVTNMPGWTKFTLIGLGVALVAFLFFWLGRILRRAGRVDETEDEPMGPAATNTDAAWGVNNADSNEWTQQ
jgi:hypothetical protein